MKITIVPHAHAVCLRKDNYEYIKDLVVVQDTTIRLLYKLKGESVWQEKVFIFNTNPASIVYDGKVLTNTMEFSCCKDDKIDGFIIIEPDDIQRYSA